MNATQTRTHWIIGMNMVGYLPESEPFCCEDELSARRAMADEVERSMDQVDEDSEEFGQLLELHTELHNLSAEQGWSGTAGYIHYWINPVPAAECECEHEG